MLQHVAAGSFAGSAFVGALLHHGVVLHLGTLVTAFLAGVCTGGADRVRERTAASDNGGGGRAGCCAVLAGLQRHQMLFLPF